MWEFSVLGLLASFLSSNLRFEPKAQHRNTQCVNNNNSRLLTVLNMLQQIHTFEANLSLHRMTAETLESNTTLTVS